MLIFVQLTDGVQLTQLTNGVIVKFDLTDIYMC